MVKFLINYLGHIDKMYPLNGCRF